MNSIFVDEKERIEVAIHFMESEGKIELLDAPRQGSEALVVKFKRASFAMSQQLMKANSVTSASGEQVVNFMQLQNSLLYALADEWNVKDAAGKPVPISEENISRMRVELARAVITKYIALAGSIF